MIEQISNSDEPKTLNELIPYIAREIAERRLDSNVPAQNTTEASRAFGREVMRLRKERGFSVFQISEAAGLDVRLVALIEKELAAPDEITPEVANALVHALGDELREHNPN